MENADLFTVYHGVFLMGNYIGIDVSKATLDIDWLGSAQSVENNLSGISKLIERLKNLCTTNDLALVICEATGGYEQKIVQSCHQAMLPVHVAHANKVRYFAKSQGLLAKTDKLDARVLTSYGRLLKPTPDSLQLTDNTKKIGELLKRREQLQADKKRETNRLDKISNEFILDSINEHIKWLDKKIKETEGELAQLKKAEDVNDAHDLLTSIPAIGTLSAHYLLSSLPEIGKLSHKAIASLVGVAPFNHDSGKGQGKRFIQGGRGRLRQVLYMASITAIRFNPDLKIFYTRLIAKGKPTKVAITAVIRKLLTMANSVMKRQTPWEEKFQKC